MIGDIDAVKIWTVSNVISQSENYFPIVFIHLCHSARHIIGTCINNQYQHVLYSQSQMHCRTLRTCPMNVSCQGKVVLKCHLICFCCCSLLCVFNHCYFHRIMDGSIIHTEHRSQDVIAELEVALSRE